MEQRGCQAEAVELADRVGQARQDALDVLGLAGVHDRGVGREEAGTEVPDPVGGAVAADAGRPGGRALGAAAVARCRPAAGQALLEEAELRVDLGEALDAREAP